MLRLLRRYPIWFIPSLAFTSGAEAADDTSVLCSWEFLVVMSAYDEACTLEQNLEMKRALAESISQLDAFIIRHSDLPNTAPLLAKKKDELRQRVFDDIDANREGGLDKCRDDEELGIAKDYREFAESNPPSKLRTWVTDDLVRAESREYPLAGICF